MFFKQDNKRSRMMEMALAMMRNQQPSNTVGAGIANATRSIAGALMANKAEEKAQAKKAENSAAIAAMLAGGNAKPWVNPDTGKTQGTAGGMEGMLAALKGHSGTDVAAQMVPQLQMAKISADQAKTHLAEQRQYNEGQKQEDRIYQAILRKEARQETLSDRETAFKQQVQLRHQDRLTRLGDKRDELRYAGDLAAQRDHNNRRIEVGLPPLSGSEPSGTQPAASGVPEMTIPEAKARNAALQKKALSAIDDAALVKKNKTAFDAFDVGMKAVETAMGDTETGPLVGNLPALTSSAQIAEGAVAAIAPVLKGLFRTSGEGTFTDKDQDLLMGMIPTRKDHPEARKAKTEMIYGIVRAKLGLGAAENAPTPDKPTRLRFNQEIGDVEDVGGDEDVLRGKKNDL